MTSDMSGPGADGEAVPEAPTDKDSLTLRVELSDAQIDQIADAFEDGAGRIRVDQVFAFARAVIAADRAHAA